VVFFEAYPKGTTDFSAILTEVRAANLDVLGAATYFDDAVALIRQMKVINLSPKIYGVTVWAGTCPSFTRCSAVTPSSSTALPHGIPSW
jgi:ABC-type branched-subunit amino acid transport system substrate-binding protein